MIESVEPSWHLDSAGARQPNFDSFKRPIYEVIFVNDEGRICLYLSPGSSYRKVGNGSGWGFSRWGAVCAAAQATNNPDRRIAPATIVGSKVMITVALDDAGKPQVVDVRPAVPPV